MTNNRMPEGAQDVFEMVKNDPVIQRRKRIREIAEKCKLLRKSGKSKQEVAEIIVSLNLPLDIQLPLLGRFSELIG